VLGAVGLKEKPHDSSPGTPGKAAVPAWGQVFRNPTVAGLALAYFFFGFYQIYATFFVAYLRRGLNLPTEVVGNIWLYWAVLGLFMIFWGWLSDRIGRKEAMTPCIIALVISVLIPMFWHDLPFLYLSAILYGATFAGPMMIILTATGDAVPPSLAVAAMGLVTAAFGLGQAVSPAIAGYFIDLTHSFYPGFVLSAVGMALTMITIYRLPLKKHG
ncbi:MAG: YbfB/YjiJ family MFS transporter, partial [Dehalococcoidia bacterium]|nr:YbfB/YjiJ family MFS transporter [Dehalococcoidia bacterium]